MDMELITAQIARLSLKPEDTLVVRCVNGPPLQWETAVRIKQEVKHVTGHDKVLVVDDRVQLSVLEPAA